jgi:hypothetical protein
MQTEVQKRYAETWSSNLNNTEKTLVVVDGRSENQYKAHQDEGKKGHSEHIATPPHIPRTEEDKHADQCKKRCQVLDVIVTEPEEPVWHN